MALTLNDVGKKKTKARKKASAKKTTTAKKKVTKKTKTIHKAKKVQARKTSKSKVESVKKVRPWQTPEEMEKIEELQTQKSTASRNDTPSSDTENTETPQPSKSVRMELAGKVLPEEVVEVLQRVEDFKNECLAQLPPEIDAIVKDSWVSKLQVYPKIKIPMPGFLTQKEKRR